MKRIFLILIPIYSFAIALTSCQTNKPAKAIVVSTIDNLDVARYMGRWYEIARYDHRFEKGMTHITAEYSLMTNGKIKVVNSGIKNGKPKSITGKARFQTKESNGKLEVSFFSFFYSDYYILELDEDYHYAVIGSRSDEYLWILSRTPKPPQQIIDSLLTKIQARGYDTTNLYFVPQN